MNLSIYLPHRALVVAQHDPRLELIGQDRHLVRAIPRIHPTKVGGFIADEEVPKRKAPRTLTTVQNLSNTYTTAPRRYSLCLSVIWGEPF